MTRIQTGAAVELIKDICNEVLSEYGIEIPIDREHIVGHCDDAVAAVFRKSVTAERGAEPEAPAEPWAAMEQSENV